MITANYSDYVDGGSHKDFEISVVGTETTYDNSQMLSESIKLDEALCSEQNLRFGSCEASQFSVQIANSAVSLEGKTINVSVTMDEETTKYGTFKVISDKPTADRIWRVITAYDKMYDIINADVLEWYKGLTFPMTLANFRNSFFNHLGISQVSTNLINDSFSIPGGFTATGSLSGKTIITAICEFNGVFGHINRDGNFEYISLDNASSFNCPPYENNSVTYQDYVTEAITKVTMRGSASDVGTSVGIAGNEYIITNNPLIYGTEGTSALTTALTNLLNKISLVTFRPFQLNKTIGNPCVELGDAIVITTKYQTINSFVLKRCLSGIQALRDNYSATGNKYYPKEVNTVQEQISRTQGKMNELTRTVDQTVSTVTSLSQNAITTDTLHYLATSLDSGVTTSTAGWTTTPQSMTPTNKYLWTYHTYTYADAHTSNTTPVITGVYGEDGQQGQPGTSVTITSQTVTYQASTSGTVTPTGTWQSSVPSVSQGQYLWTRTIVNYSNGTSTTSYSVSYQGQNGQSGTGVTVSSIQYASSSSGTTAPSSGWQTTIPSVSDGDYLWTKTTYSDNTVAYTNSRQGEDGQAGTGVSEVIPLYYASSSNTAPSAPSSNVTTNTDVQGAWTRVIPTLTTTYKYLFTCDQIKYTNNTYTWSTVVLNNALTDIKSSIDQLAGEIVLKVDNNGNVVAIRLDGTGQAGTVTIKGDNIQLDGNVHITSGFVLNVGTIQSANYVANTSGMKITLSDGQLDSKYFKITSSGVKLTGELVAYDTIKMVAVGYADEFDFIKYDLGQGPDDWSIVCKAVDGNTIWSYTAQGGAYFNIAKYTRSSVGDLGWRSGNQDVIAKSALAFWNGAYSSTSSNLAYCNKGAFGDMATANKSGFTMTGGLHFANTTWNKVGDEAQFADANVAGHICIQGLTGQTGIRFYKNGDASKYGNWDFTGSLFASNVSIYIPNNCAYDIYSRAQFTDLNTASACLCANNGAFIRRYDNKNTAAQINASAFNTASSRLVKENIRPIDDEIIEKVLQLDVKSFDYNGKTRVEKNQTGMIAEDVLEILPQFVHVPDNYDEEETKRKLDNNEFTETLSIDYSNFVPALIKLVQMQQKQINDLKNLIKTEE